jgi:hypothetical protein
MSSKFADSDGEQVQFTKDIEELADFEEFLEYQDQLHLCIRHGVQTCKASKV